MPNEYGRPKVKGQRSKRKPVALALLSGAVMLLAADTRPLPAQTVVPDSQALRVYLMTMGPGDAVWERFGHNAIRIRDERTGEDRVYNWGMFSLDDTGFILRFLRGRMRYWMASEDAALTVEAYRSFNRSVTVQELNLTGAQKVALYGFVKLNELPENRFYDYDYFRDNCSTRVRDALDAALGGTLGERFRAQRTELTYRDHSRRLMQPDPLIYTGIDIGLGRLTDQPLSAWEEMFIPMSLQRYVREARVRNGNGDEPLVLTEQVLAPSTRPPVGERPAQWVWAYLLIGIVLAGIIVATSLTRAAPVATFLTVSWSVVAGLLGTLVVLLWLATEHVAAYQNANVLALNPVWLGLAWLTVARSRNARPLAIVLTAAAASAMLLWPFPGHQDTTRLLALVLPVHLAAAYVISRRIPRT